MSADDGVTITMTMTLDPTSHRLLTRMAEMERVPVAEVAAMIITISLRQLMPQSYVDGPPDDKMCRQDGPLGPMTLN